MKPTDQQPAATPSKFKYYVTLSWAPGERSEYQDRYIAESITNNQGRRLWILAVMDGHGGVDAAEAVKAHLVDDLLLILSKPTKSGKDLEPEDILKELVAKLAKRTQEFAAGTTLSLALVDESNDMASIAILGDSPVFYVDKTGKIRRAPHHNARTNQVERQGAIDRGAKYEDGYLYDTLNRSGLQISRGLGDAYARFLSTEPEIVLCDLRKTTALVLASDGLDDPHMPAEEADEHLAELFAQNANAQTLAKDAVARQTGDNITVLVLRPTPTE